MTWEVRQGDARTLLQAMPAASVQCCVTSPPYYGLRDYGVDGQLGLESTVEEYVQQLVAVFREVRRVLRDDGIMFLNLGDSYYGSWGNYGGQNRGKGTQRAITTGSQVPNPAYDSLEHFRPPTAGRSRGVGSGSGGRASQGSSLRGSFSGNLCGECVDARSPSNPDTGPHRASRRTVSASESSRAHTGLPPDHLGSSRSTSPADHTADATLDRGPSEVRAAEPPHVSPSSMHGESSPRSPGACSHCTNCGVCLSVVGSSMRDGKLCAYRRGDIFDIGQRESVVRTLGKDASDSAYPHSTTAFLKPKDLVGVPWRVAFALQRDGWWLRSDIIWAKQNCMPESVRDRPTRSHEYLFLLTKSSRYYYDATAIKEPYTSSSGQRLGQAVDLQAGSLRAHGGTKANGPMKAVVFGGTKAAGYGTRWHSGKPWIPGMAIGASVNTRTINYLRANKRDVWFLPTQGYAGAHFATFPESLVEPCLRAGSKEGDTVLDCFAGSGTTGVVALKLQRIFIGLELNPAYCAMARKRIGAVMPLFEPLR